jgi:predicted CopG family antitoxin
MIINVSVDMSEFYTEEEGQSFSQAVKDYISYDVKRKVLEDFKAKAGDQFQSEIIAKIQEQKDAYINGVLSELVTTALIKKRYSSH